MAIIIPHSEYTFFAQFLQIIQEIYNGRFASNKGKGPVFATTWINMQDAYFQEKNDVGDWTEIGYSAPGTGSSHSYESNVFRYGDGGAGSNNWMADPKVKLNDCEAADAGTGSWKLTASTNASDENAATAFGIADASQGGADCLNLTASWSSLTRSSN